MHNTSLTHTLAPRLSSCAGEASLASLTLFIVLALLPPFAWGQTAVVLKGPHSLGPAPIGPPSSATVSPANSRYKFFVISPPHSPYAVADGINNDRVVSGYYLDQSSVYHGFVFSGGQFRTVDYPGAAYTLLYGVSNQGEAIGYYNDGTADHVITYSVSSGAWGSLPDIPNYSLNQGYCINDGGAAVGNAYEGSTSVAWIWDPGTSSYSFFVAPGAAANGTFPSCLNDKNEIVGYYADSNGVYHGFLGAYGTYTTVDAPGAADTYPDGINNRGTIQGQLASSSGALEGFTATAGGVFHIVNYPGAQATAVVGINDAGDLCGSEGGTNFADARAFVAIPQQ